MTRRMVRVESPTFVAAYVVDVESNRVVEAAPILRRWLMGRTVGEARRIVIQKGWRFSEDTPSG